MGEHSRPVCLYVTTASLGATCRFFLSKSIGRQFNRPMQVAWPVELCIFKMFPAQTVFPGSPLLYLLMTAVQDIISGRRWIKSSDWMCLNFLKPYIHKADIGVWEGRSGVHTAESEMCARRWTHPSSVLTHRRLQCSQIHYKATFFCLHSHVESAATLD